MKKIDYIEIYVSNLPMAIHYYKSTFQFKTVAYKNYQDVSSVLLQHGLIRIILTSSKDNQSDISQFCYLHGDGVKDIGFVSDNVDEQYHLAIQHGAKSFAEPTVHHSSGQVMITATVSAFGVVTHTFIQRESEENYSLPHFIPFQDTSQTIEPVLHEIDHIAVCVNPGEIVKWMEFYKKVYGCKQSHEEYVTTENSGMNSIVVQSEAGAAKIVFVEPVSGPRQSQIAEFLKNFGGPGVQHIAFATENIVTTVEAFRSAGIEFLTIPDHYYAIQKAKFENNEVDFDLLRKHSILVDKNDSGYLYQVFSKPVTSRHTLFFEVIQRAGSDGFGSGNIKALFQAVEQEQLQREAVNF